MNFCRWRTDLPHLVGECDYLNLATAASKFANKMFVILKAALVNHDDGFLLGGVKKDMTELIPHEGVGMYVDGTVCQVIGLQEFEHKASLSDARKTFYAKD